MNKREKIKEGLGQCQYPLEVCINRACPYFDRADHGDCIHMLHKDALSLIKAQDILIEGYNSERGQAYWIHCRGKSNIWYCSNCDEKINYNPKRGTYIKEKRKVWEIYRYCRGCGYTMIEDPNGEKWRWRGWIKGRRY